MHEAYSSLSHHSLGAVVALAGTEITAAAAFTIPRPRRAAAAVLAIVFLLASALTVHAGQSPVHLLFCVCTVAFIIALTPRTGRASA